MYLPEVRQFYHFVLPSFTFLEEESLPDEEVMGNIEIYSDRDEFAHAKSRVRKLVKTGSW